MKRTSKYTLKSQVFVFSGGVCSYEQWLRLSLVRGDWTEWTTWTECSQTCHHGNQTRYRTCLNPLPESGLELVCGHVADNETRSCLISNCSKWLSVSHIQLIIEFCSDHPLWGKETIDRFHSRGQQLCKLLWIKESFNMWKDFNFHRISLQTNVATDSLFCIQIWPPWRHVKNVIYKVKRRIGPKIGWYSESGKHVNYNKENGKEKNRLEFSRAFWEKFPEEGRLGEILVASVIRCFFPLLFTVDLYNLNSQDLKVVVILKVFTLNTWPVI